VSPEQLEKLRARALAASRRAAEALIARTRQRPAWVCAHCGGERPATVHQMRKTYCSKACMAEAYRERLRGDANPNFRGAGVHLCPRCRKPFRSYHKRKYCSRPCYVLSVPADMRHAPRKDYNHAEIVGAIRDAGGAVIDSSAMGRGFPDLIVCTKSRLTVLAEIKNPKSGYGKQGLNKLQAKFAEVWPGVVVVLRTVEDAVALVNDRYEGLEKNQAVDVGAWIMERDAIEKRMGTNAT
jgi:hypothetical protein